jgi:hypothetical protein
MKLNKLSFTILLLVLVLFGCKKETKNTDKIIDILTTSRANYEAATLNTWIEISAAEYDKLASQLDNITRSGTSEADYTNNTVSTETSEFGWTFAQNDGNTMPNGSYLIAIKINVAEIINAGSKVKLSSTSVTTGFSDVGNALPSLPAGERFLLLKGGSSKTTNIGYLGLYKTSGRIIGNNIEGKGKYSFENGNSNAPGDLYANLVFQYQGLSTTTIQW